MHRLILLTAFVAGCLFLREPSGTAAAAGKAGDRADRADSYHVYIGTYTRPGKSKGIYLSRMNARTGEMSPAELAAEITNPSFLAIHPNRRFLYAVTEVGSFGGKRSGAVSSFLLDRETGRLKKLNHQPSGGRGPCHLVVDPSGKNVLVANYGGGSVAAIPVAANGMLRESSSVIQHKGSSVNPRRQSAPHAHSINVDPAGRFAFAADLGLDKVLVYRLDPQAGTLTANTPPSASVKPGAGPRHFAFHPGGRFAYVINEIHSTVTAFSYDARTGTLTDIQTLSTLASPVKGNSTAEVRVHPSGKFLYGSNRGHDSIAIFRINQKTGRLTALGHQKTGGKTPRNFNLDPSGRWLLAANQNSDSVVVFRVDLKTGLLKPAGAKLAVGAPVCVRFVPIGR